MVEENAHEIIAIDEVLLVHDISNNKKIWLIGLINTRTKYFWIEGIDGRSTEIIKK